MELTTPRLSGVTRGVTPTNFYWDVLVKEIPFEASWCNEKEFSRVCQLSPNFKNLLEDWFPKYRAKSYTWTQYVLPEGSTGELFTTVLTQSKSPETRFGPTSLFSHFSPS